MLSNDELDRIAAVLHSDPHTALGPHRDGGARFVVRVFRPDARAVKLVVAGGSTDMERVHAAGIFAASLEGAASDSVAPAYRLEVTRDDGTVEVVEDAYAYPPTLGDIDLHLAAEGTHREVYRHLGAHVVTMRGVTGVRFAVWAPAAQRVSVVGDWNRWDARVAAMRRLGSGIWEIFQPAAKLGDRYKFDIVTMQGDVVQKADPYGRAMERRPSTASRIVERRFAFTDEAWMAARGKVDPRSRPVSIYEVHLGSWRTKPLAKGEDGREPDRAERWYSYAELAESLVDYVADMGFTHVELLPIMEHPFDGSWGYQVSGYYAPTARYGEPDELRAFVDRCHARGIGVILDWTPAHFPKDAFALGRFDGTALYEHLDPRLGEHRQWNTFIFNYGRPEVRNFLVANALYWLDEFHVDGIRVDAVASMLYLDYAANGPGDWVPNEHGGRENLAAVAFVRELNEQIHARFPGALVCAEESTSWPGVTKPAYVGGLGFDLKWNMGWMHDTLDYFSFDPIHRAYHHGKLTFSIWYAFNERFLLPLSHDEVVHLKRSLLSKMPGDRETMHRNLRAMLALMWAHPGKKLLFMGGEIGQYREWSFERELDWFLLGEADHQGLQRLVRDLNQLYRKYPALYELDHDPQGFRWIDCNDAPQSVVAFLRFQSAIDGGRLTQGASGKGVHVVVVCNFTPVTRTGYRFGVPRRSAYLEVLNTDATVYSGRGAGNYGRVPIEDVPCHGFPQSIVLTLPGLSVTWFVPELEDDPANAPSA